MVEKFDCFREYAIGCSFAATTEVLSPRVIQAR